MRHRTATTNDTGHQASWDRAETATARQLARCLPGYGLDKLADDEAVAVMRFLIGVLEVIENGDTASTSATLAGIKIKVRVIEEENAPKPHEHAL